jgi:hypothetical protein
MQELMNGYDALRDDVRSVRRWKHAAGANATQNLRDALTHTGHVTPEQHNVYQPALTASEHRHDVSRFFVKIRRLAQAGYIPEDLIEISLARHAIEIFLDDIDPLDEVVAGEQYSDIDRRFYRGLLSRRYPGQPGTGSRESIEASVRPLQLTLPDGGDAFRIRVGSFDIEEYGEEEDGSPRFNYGDGYEVWRGRVHNVGAIALTGLQVRVIGFTPAVLSPDPGQAVEAALLFTLLTLPLFASGDTQTFDLLVHHHGSPFVSFRVDAQPRFYIREEPTVMEIRCFAAEGSFAGGRLEIRGTGEHYRVEVRGL